jgi:hypothetical protein
LRFSRKFVSFQEPEIRLLILNDVSSVCPVMDAFPPQPATALFNQQQIDAIELLLQDLGSVDPHLQHRASFQCCWRELSQLRGELVNLLLSRRSLARQATDTPASRSRAGG